MLSLPEVGLALLILELCQGCKIDTWGKVMAIVKQEILHARGKGEVSRIV
jgi:hypothetical protein